MLHPIIRSIRTAVLYAFAWVTVAIVHSLLLYYIIELSLKIAILDSLLYNTLFALTGLIIWFPVKYLNVQENKIITVVAGHLVTSIFVISAWVLSSNGILSFILSEDIQYLDLSHQAKAWRYVVGFLFYIILSLLYYVIVYYENLQEKLAFEVQLQTQINETKLNYLKAQINPHFLFNSLNSISSLTILEPDKAHEMTLLLSDYMRYTFSHDDKKQVSLQIN